MKHARSKIIPFFVLVISHSCNSSLLEILIGSALGRDVENSADDKNSKVYCQILVEKYGYPFESHEVVSESGYVLSLHRIPHGIKRKPTSLSKRPVALFQHGIFAASDSWLFRGPESDLPYVLADSGYDVWLSNMRGNTYSKNHVTLDSNRDVKFWDFSLHEVAYYDYPVIVDYILNKTKQENLYFLGHSIGSTVGMIFTTLRPEYNQKIRLQLALAPLVYVNHSISFGQKLIFLPGIPLSRMAINNHIYNIFPRRSGFTKMLQILCSDGTPLQPICLNLIFATVGTDYEQLNTTHISNFVTFYPAGTSIYLMLHTLQLYLTGKFSPYDYGNLTLNLEKYKHAHPEPYNISLVTHPVSLHYGNGDILVTEEDIEVTHSKLPNAIGKFKVPYEHFNHMDFMWGTDNRKLLFDRLVKIMDKYR